MEVQLPVNLFQLDLTSGLSQYHQMLVIHGLIYGKCILDYSRVCEDLLVDYLSTIDHLKHYFGCIARIYPAVITLLIISNDNAE